MMLGFLSQDDTPAHLMVTYNELKELKSLVTDRFAKVKKDLNAVKRIFARYDERQLKCKRAPLKKEAHLFEALCVFDPTQIDDLLTEELNAVEAEIAKSKAGARERLREQLAALVVEIDDGRVCELAAAINAKFEAEIRRKIKAEVRKEVENKLHKKIEAEYAAKINEAKVKIAEEAKIEAQKPL